MGNTKGTTSVHYRRAVMSLFVLAGVYLACLAYVTIVSIAVGEVQHFFSFILWGGIVIWCGQKVQKGSNTARKWAVFLFALHLVFSIFYIIFPISNGLTAPLLFVAILSGFGLYHSLKARVHKQKEVNEPVGT